MELSRHGFTPGDSGPGWVRFECNAEGAARAALSLRSPSRVVLELASALPADGRDGPTALSALPWESWIARSEAWAVRATGTNSALRSPLHTARLVKDAIRDRFGARGLACPPVDTREPRVLVDARVEREQLTVGLDLAGGSLHRRGPARRGPPPLREDLAAGLALLAGVEPGRAVVDPFCGTGTLIGEAVCLALSIAPRREPARMPLSVLPAFRRVDLARIAAQLRERVESSAPPIVAADRDPSAVAQARRVFESLGIARFVDLRTASIENLAPPRSADGGVVLTNPPWGLRLAGPDTEDAWRALGRFAHALGEGWTLAVLSGARGLSRGLGLKANRRWPVIVGGVDSRLLVYSIGRSGQG